jgi:hypothetical protein
MDKFPSVMADGIRQKWIPGVNAVSKPDTGSLADLLISGSFTLSSCTPGSTAIFNVPVGDNTLQSCFAGEATRFGSACFESFIGAAPGVGAERSLGWPLIRTYYAAFFAAHALLRICGESLTFLSAAHANALDNLGTIYLGNPIRFSSGLFYFRSLNKGKQLQVTQVGRHGGSHDELWRYFHNYLVDVENQLATFYAAVPVAIQAIQTSQILRKGLSKNGSTLGGWLSKSRNSINYHHDRGVWFPYKIQKHHANTLVRSFSQWMDDEAEWSARFKNLDDLQSHVNFSQAIGSLLLFVLKDLSERNVGAGRSFADRGPFALIRQRIKSVALPI